MNTTATGAPAPSVADALAQTGKLIWEAADKFTKRQLAWSFVLLILGSTLGALVPVLYKLLIDAFSGNATPGTQLTPAVLITVYVIFAWSLSSSRVLRQYVHGLGTQRLNRLLSNRLFEHVLRLPMNFHAERRTGAVGVTLGQGLSGCQTLLQHAVFTFLPVIVEFVAIVVVLVHFGHSMYLAILAVSAVAYGYAFWRSAERVIEPSKQVSESYVNSHATLTDSLLNYETVKYFAGERETCRRYDGTLDTTERSWRSLMKLKARYGLFLESLYTVSIGASLGLAGFEVLRGTMTVGDFVLINTYIMRLYQPLEAMGIAARDMSQATAFLRKMLDIFDEKTEETGRPSRPAPIDVRGELTFANVCFSYKPDRPLLKDVSFDVPAGKTLAIVGASGSGKSSLIRLLFRLYEPNSGSILLDGIPISSWPLERLREAIAIVPQDTVLFNDTIGSNIAFARAGATQAEIEHAARLAHLHHFISALPEGYETPVGERGVKLSGGEKQRVAIARAALKRPRIFVFDEATSSLDSSSEREILQNLLDVAQNCTTLVIAHRLSTIVHADEILVMDQGSVVERGSHRELLAADTAYATLWRAQQGNHPSTPRASSALRQTSLQT